MPVINTWISDDDYNKYLVVKQSAKGAWTEFIHAALNGAGNEPSKPVQPKVIKTKEDVSEVIEQVFPRAQLFDRRGTEPIPKAYSARKKK